MKFYKLAVVIGACLAGGGMVFGEEIAEVVVPSPKQQEAEREMPFVLKKMKEKLELTEAQVEELRPVFDEYINRSFGVTRDKVMTMDARNEKMAELCKERDAKVEAVLNEGQKARYEAMSLFGKDKDPKLAVPLTLRKMKEELELTDEQVGKLYPAAMTHLASSVRIRRDKDTSPELRREKEAAVDKAWKTEVMRVLNTEQATKYESEPDVAKDVAIKSESVGKNSSRLQEIADEVQMRKTERLLGVEQERKDGGKSDVAKDGADRSKSGEESLSRLQEIAAEVRARRAARTEANAEAEVRSRAGGAKAGEGERYVPFALKKMKEKLGLTEEQVEELMPVITEYRREHLRVRTARFMTIDGFNAKIAELSEARDEKIGTVLNAEQKAKYDSALFFVGVEADKYVVPTFLEKMKKDLDLSETQVVKLYSSADSHRSSLVMANRIEEDSKRWWVESLERVLNAEQKEKLKTLKAGGAGCSACGCGQKKSAE